MTVRAGSEQLWTRSCIPDLNLLTSTFFYPRKIHTCTLTLLLTITLPVHGKNSRSSRLLSSLSSFSSSSSSLLFQLLQKAVAKYRCFFRIHVPCDQQCEGFNSRKCVYENISGKWHVRVLTHFPRDYFFSLTFNNHTVENAEVPISPAEASVYWNPAQLQKVLCVKTACF